MAGGAVMRWVAIVLALGLGVAAYVDQDAPLPAVQSPQQTAPQLPAIPENEHRDDKFRDDPHARCMRPEVVAYYPENTSLHPCSCPLMCMGHDNNADGVNESHSQAESVACQMYCSKQRCACHPDDPCNNPMVGDGTLQQKPTDDGNPFDAGVVPR